MPTREQTADPNDSFAQVLDLRDLNPPSKACVVGCESTRVELLHHTASPRPQSVLWQVADIKDGRLIRLRIYLADTEALEAAGL